MKELIAATTDANTDEVISIPDDSYYSFAQTGLAGAETIDFEISLGGAWTGVLPAIQLTATVNYIQLAGPAAYRINKPSTAGAVAVYAEN
jgi:hypothetical protein